MSIIISERRNGAACAHNAFRCTDEADFIARIRETQLQARSDEPLVETTDQAIDYLDERHAQTTTLITEADFRASRFWDRVVITQAEKLGWVPTGAGIIEKNAQVLEDFFKGLASCDYYDGLSHQLYLDLDDMTLSINTEASDQSWLQRDDGSLVQILRVSGYADTPEDERYDAERGDDISDYGYSDWLEVVEQKIDEAISETF